jgi:hypothetical protein
MSLYHTIPYHTIPYHTIPEVTIEIPSLTPMGLKIKPIASFLLIPILTYFAKSFKCMLHEFPS